MIKSNTLRQSRAYSNDWMRSSRINDVRTNSYKNMHQDSVSRSPIHVHEIFLNSCRKEFTDVEVVTKSGEIIIGIIDGYDQDTIVLHNEMTQLLIYKHSINYISPRNGKRLIIPEREMNRISEESTLVIDEKKKVN